MKKLILVCGFVIIGFTPAYAQTGIYIEAGGFAYRYLTENDTENSFTGGYIKADMNFDLGRLAFKVSPRIRYESLFNEGGANLIWEDEFRHTFTFSEAYAEVNLEAFRLGAGKKILKPCLLKESPTCSEDGWSPHDFIDPLPGFDEYLGVPGVWIRSGGRKLSLELMYSPEWTRSKLPYSGRWSLFQALPAVDFVHLGGGDKLYASLKAWKGSSLFGVVFYNGNDYAPNGFLDLGGEISHVEYLYPKRTSVTGQFANYGTLIKRMTLGYSDTGGIGRLEFGGELESQKLSDGGSTGLLIGAISSLRVDSISFEASTPTNLRYGWNNTVYGGVEFEEDDWNIRLPIALVDSYGIVFLPEIRNRRSCEAFCTFFEVAVRGMVLSGSKDSFLGQYEDNDRVEVIMKIGF